MAALCGLTQLVRGVVDLTFLRGGIAARASRASYCFTVCVPAAVPADSASFCRWAAAGLSAKNAAAQYC